jgi:branched-chain amino acid transport system ATP-binding protein
VSIADLVARAAEASRAAHGTAQPVPLPRPATTPRALLSRPVLTHVTSGTVADADRLQAVLTEIEEAAARARTWRPDPNLKPRS